jgi:hypothetical protein
VLKNNRVECTEGSLNDSESDSTALCARIEQPTQSLVV